MRAAYLADAFVSETQQDAEPGQYEQQPVIGMDQVGHFHAFGKEKMFHSQGSFCAKMYISSGL